VTAPSNLPFARGLANFSVETRLPTMIDVCSDVRKM
jgi:hypothetical protein